MKNYFSLLLCCITWLNLSAHDAKAPRPGNSNSPQIVNAIVGKQDDTCCEAVIPLLQKILTILECDENQNCEEILQELQEQNGLLLQQLGFNTLSLAQQQEILTILQRNNVTEDDNGTVQTALLTQLVAENQQNCSPEDEQFTQILQLINILLTQLLVQQQTIETLQQEQANNFETIESNLQIILAQLTLQQSQLQQISADVAALVP